MTTIYCHTRGPRQRPRHTRALAPPPLLGWHARAPRGTNRVARLLLRDYLCDAEGEPRACLEIPGWRLPITFPSIAAALTAPIHLEAAHACR